MNTFANMCEINASLYIYVLGPRGGGGVLIKFLGGDVPLGL